MSAYTGPHPQLNPVVLSDTLNEWREKTNKHVDILNYCKVYDIVHADGITYNRVGGDIVLEVAPNIAKGITIGGDLVVEGNIQFTGTAARFDVSVLMVEDHQIELGVSGAADSDTAATNDAGIDDGGIVILSTDSNKKWTYRNSFSGHQAWVSDQHIGLTAGKAIVGGGNAIHFKSSSYKGIDYEFRSDLSGKYVTDISFSPSQGATATMFGNGEGTGGIRIREDGHVEIFNGVNRKFITQPGHGFKHGDIVRFDGNVYVKAQANTEVTAEAIGVVDRYSFYDYDKFVLVTHGEVQGFGVADAGEGGAGELTPGEIYFLSQDLAGKSTIVRPTEKGNIVKPMFLSVSETSGYVLNYIGGIIPNQDIIANNLPQVYHFDGDGTTTIFGLSGSASTHSGTHIVSIDGIMQTPQNDFLYSEATGGSGNDVMYGVSGGVTGDANFQILQGPGDFSFGAGNRIEFINPPPEFSSITVINQSLTTPYADIDETYVLPKGTSESRLFTVRLGEYVSVKDYGALGDGISDDTMYIQRAIDQTSGYASEKKRKIFFPSGYYKISETIKINNDCILVGEGWDHRSTPVVSGGGSIISMSPGMTGPAITFVHDEHVSHNRSYATLNMEYIRVHAVEGTTGSDGYPGPILDLTGFWRSNIKNCRFDAYWNNVPRGAGSGIRVCGWYQNKIEGCYCAGTIKGIEILAGVPANGPSGGVLAGWKPEYTRPSTLVSVKDCTIGGLKAAGDLAGTDTFGIDIIGGETGVNNVCIENNVFLAGPGEDNDYGISIEGPNDNIMIKNNQFGVRAWHSNGYSSNMKYGITASGETNNLVSIGNIGSKHGNTGAGFVDNDKFQGRVEIENGSVQCINTPKCVVTFDGQTTPATECSIRGGTGSGSTGTAYNVSKVVRGGMPGAYSIWFDSPLQTDNYNIQGTVGGKTAAFISAGDPATEISTSTCTVYCYNHEGNQTDPANISVVII